jgi:hypothetical protein
MGLGRAGRTAPSGRRSPLHCKRRTFAPDLRNGKAGEIQRAGDRPKVLNYERPVKRIAVRGEVVGVGSGAFASYGVVSTPVKRLSTLHAQRANGGLRFFSDAARI